MPHSSEAAKELRRKVEQSAGRNHLHEHFFSKKYFPQFLQGDKFLLTKLNKNYLKGKDVKRLTSLMIIGDFISTDRKLYENVELSVQGILCASVKVSVESVVETVVSRYCNILAKIDF